MDTVPKEGIPLGDWAREASESSPFRSAASFVVKIRAEQGGRCLEIPSLFEWMGEEYPYPLRSQMVKVELEGEFSEVVRNA